MFDFIPKPKDKRWQLINVVGALFILTLTFWYFLQPTDIIIDQLGIIGYMDDIIIGLIGLYAAYRFYNGVTTKFNANKAVYKEMWRKGDITSYLLSWKFWKIIFWLGLVISYWLWTTDIVPEYLGALGWVDDVFVAITGLVMIIKIAFGGKGARK